MSRLIKSVLINLLCVVVFAFAGSVHATVRVLNNGGGTNSSNALEITITDSAQMQIRRLGTGQLYQPTSFPSGNYPYNTPYTLLNPRSALDNGVFIRYNNAMYGASNFSYNPSNLGMYNSYSISAVSPGNTSQGVTQSTTSSLSLTSSTTSSPTVSIVWKYTYPLDYVTAEVTLTIPSQATVSTTNPIRYYHAVDTYLGGSDNGCGVRYTDTNGKLVVGTYPLTNGTCPSSNSLPPNLDVVESFRERNGKFDHYCVGYWSDFWSTSSFNPPACAISKSGSLGDSVTTTYQDTGAAIEFDFTAAGTYTFSYDFVVGSTFVPNYDHLEIRHPGSSSLCPVDVQVLACLSSTVPCPSDQLVSSGLLQGSLTVSPTTPTITDTPDPFSLGTDASTATVTLQGSAAATYTLGASGLTKAPLSGVKCWNTATNSQSCSFVVTSTPCLSSFECMESGLTYAANARNPIYTKLNAKAFDLDVYALTSGGAKATGYVSATNSVTVELVTDSGGTCGNSLTPVAKKTVSFVAADAGKKTVSFTNSDVPNAYPNLRCRVIDTNLNKNGCSSDNFTVRPQSLTVASTNAQPASQPTVTPGPTSTPVVKAGTVFNLQATTGESNYTGTPKIASITAHNGYVAVGTLSFTSNGTTTSPATSFPAAVAGTSSGDTFKYSEVGLFQFTSNGVYDDTFTAVDKANNDCILNSYDNTGSGTPTKYGCNVGSSASVYFGRFIPDHFVETPGTANSLACGSFVYYGQFTSTVPSFTVPFIITAQNVANTTTQNYNGDYGAGYAKLDLSNFNKYYFTTDAPNGATLSSSQVTPAFTNTSSGTAASWDKGVAKISAKLQLSRPASNTPPQNVTLSAKPVDDDGVTSTATTVITTAGIPFRYGRLAMTPAHGSELLPLSVPIEAQYWNGSTAYIRSTNDSCTTVDPKAVTMKNYKGNLSACETYISAISSLGNGVLGAVLAAPKIGSDGKPNTGSVDLEININSASGEQTCQSSGGSISSIVDSKPWFGNIEPGARATFGIYKAPIIYMRENF